MDIFLSTNNLHKIKELKGLTEESGLPISVLLAKKAGSMPEVEENQDTFKGNARLKAEALKKIVPESSWILADDSGLCVDALDGAPGVNSARYAGYNASSEENNQKLLRAMKYIPIDQRRARYVCCLLLIHPIIGEVVFHSICKGTIMKEPKGSDGFGYDPLFMPLGGSRTFSEMGMKAKNKISHRGQALRQLMNWLKEYA